jgi:hypothetical protein
MHYVFEYWRVKSLNNIFTHENSSDFVLKE